VPTHSSFAHRSYVTIEREGREALPPFEINKEDHMNTIESDTRSEAAIGDESGLAHKGPLLVGVDSSDGAQHALAWSTSLAKRTGASMVLAHASSPWLGLGMSIPPFDYDMYRDSAERVVEKWAGQIEGVECKTRLIEDDAAEGLNVLAAEVNPSLIVLGAHPRRHWTPHVLGSTTAKVLHSTRRPMAVVPRSAPIEATGRGLLVGVDGSDSSRRALRRAANLGVQLGVAVHAVCAYPFEPYAEKPRFVDSDGEDAIRDTSHALQSVVAQVGDETGCEITSDVVLGHPADRLLSVAGEFWALVVGKTGHGSFGDMMLGSIVRAAATHSPVPVLVIP
jgi:nucleotide-binding universal stress UspA family protein